MLLLTNTVGKCHTNCVFTGLENTGKQHGKYGVGLRFSSAGKKLSKLSIFLGFIPGKCVSCGMCSEEGKQLVNAKFSRICCRVKLLVNKGFLAVLAFYFCTTQPSVTKKG